MALINYITTIQFERGALALVMSECQRIGIRRPLLVTDVGVREAGIVRARASA